MGRRLVVWRRMAGVGKIGVGVWERSRVCGLWSIGNVRHGFWRRVRPIKRTAIHRKPMENVFYTLEKKPGCRQTQPFHHAPSHQSCVCKIGNHVKSTRPAKQSTPGAHVPFSATANWQEIKISAHPHALRNYSVTGVSMREVTG